MLEKLFGHARVRRFSDREGTCATRRGVNGESLLSTLWNGVVNPVFDALGFLVRDIASIEFIPRSSVSGEQTLGDLSRFFWCPTGPFVFLLIHAAGFYDTQHSQPEHKVFDVVVSSYVPTLSVLAPSLNPTVPSNGDLRPLAVGQPPSDGLPPLPGVDT